jgi:hypothetical protein
MAVCAEQSKYRIISINSSGGSCSRRDKGGERSGMLGSALANKYRFIFINSSKSRCARRENCWEKVGCGMLGSALAREGTLREALGCGCGAANVREQLCLVSRLEIMRYLFQLRNNLNFFYYSRLLCSSIPLPLGLRIDDLWRKF